MQMTHASAAEAFYCGKLGFHLDFRVPGNEKQNDPCCMGVSRDGALIHLSSNEGDGAIGGVVLILCRDLDELYAEFVAKGVSIYLAPVNQPWGMRELCVRDPDGNRVRFAAPVERN